MNKKIIPPLLVISIGANAFFGYHHIFVPSGEVKQQLQYPLLSKRIFVENSNDMILNFIPLREALREYVIAQNGKVGVYFEYLPSGISIGVNDREEVKLASLSKVPLVMSILKKVERKHLTLDTKLTLREEWLDKKFGSLWQKGAGATFTVEELINYSLKESDNTAYEALFSQLSGADINEVYDNLDIQISNEQGSNYPLVSPKSYSSIFRSLYLSSFLNQEGSTFILDILTKTIFNDKIPAGLPKEILVAHKIGTYERQDTSEDVHIDCGIVYFPNRPYTLCIFVQDSNEQALKHMSYISKIVYEYLSLIQIEKISK